MNEKLEKYSLCIKPFTISEWILSALFIGFVLIAGFGANESIIVPVFIGAYIVPVSTFANNFSNIAFLLSWLTGLLLLFFLFEIPFYLGPLFTLVLYFVAKYLFKYSYKRDLIFGSTSAGRVSNSWYSGSSRVDGSVGDSNDMTFQISVIVIAVMCLYLGAFN